jgi:hypothetical protein
MINKNDYLTTVYHKKLDVDFLLKISADSFNRRKDNEIIECFDNDNCRKFIKSYLTLKDGQITEKSKKTKRKAKLPKPEPISEIEEVEEAIPEEIKREIKETEEVLSDDIKSDPE